MTVAATSSFDPTVAQMITEAYRDLDVINEMEAPTAAQYNAALFRLNSLVKGLEATGIHVWTEEEAILFLQAGQARYQIGSPNGGNAHTAAADAYEQAQLSQSYGPASIAVMLSSTVGMSVGDNIGIGLDAGPTFWTTIASVPSLTSVGLTDAIPSSASSGNTVIAYAQNGEITRPLKVPNARLLTYSGNTAGQPGQETPMTILSRQEYMDLPNKNAPGVPTQWFYTPQRDVGYLYVWPVGNLPNWAVRFTWYRPLADCLTAANTLDFPQEWAAPLRWMLAYELLPGYSAVSPARMALIKEKYAEWMTTVSGWDRESEPVQFGYDYRW